MRPIFGGEPGIRTPYAGGDRFTVCWSHQCFSFSIFFGRGTENRTLVNRLKAYYFATKLYLHTTICFADALFAMLNGINCSLTVYVHSYGELTFTQWLTSAKQMALGTRIELVFPPWKGSVLTDRRTEQTWSRWQESNLHKSGLQSLP